MAKISTNLEKGEKIRVKYIGMGGIIEKPCYEDENGKIYFDENDGNGSLLLYTGAYRDKYGDICGEPCSRVTLPIECEKPFVRHPRQFDYMLLSRLQADCNYYISCGGCGKNNLWSDIDTILNKMDSILKSFEAEDMPEWLTAAEFEQLKNKVQEVQKAYEDDKETA